MNRRDSNLIALAEKIENEMSCEKLYATLVEIVNEADTVEFRYFMRQLLYCSAYDKEVMIANKDTVFIKVLNIGKYISSIVDERLMLNKTVNLRKRRIVNNINNIVQIRRQLESENIGRGYINMIDNQIKIVLAQFTVVLGENLHIEYKKGWKHEYVRLRSDLLRVLRDRISHIEDNYLRRIDVYKIIRHHIFSSYHRYFAINPSDNSITQSKALNTLLDYYHMLRSLNIFLPNDVQTRIFAYIIDNESNLFEQLSNENIELKEKVDKYDKFIDEYVGITDPLRENQLDDCPCFIIRDMRKHHLIYVPERPKSNIVVSKFILSKRMYKYRSADGTDDMSKSREHKGIVNRGLVRIHAW